MAENKKTFYPSTALVTDFYEITMAYAYWKKGMKDSRAIFQMFSRRNPMKGGYTIFAGLGTLADLLENFRFSDEDVDYLRQQKDEKGVPFFEEGFLSFLKELRFTCDILAMEEGRVVFPNEPLLRIMGPVIQTQLLESIILNTINFQTLVATKAARVCDAAGGGPVLEFGLRRAQGIDGALSAARAAYIGGCSATSNVFAGKMLGIPVRGTHAHSWVMAFETELEAFKAYSDVMPSNTIFLVDTYDTLQGVANAIKAAEELEEKGYRLKGIRLDSGDLAYLSIKAREMLDNAGLYDCKIVASSSLDEQIIQSLKNQGAKIDMWGVGTKLAVGYPEGALDGVYKLAAIEKEGKWEYRMKISEKLSKVSITGIPQVRRYYNKDGIVEADLIFDEMEKDEDYSSVKDPFSIGRSKRINKEWSHRDLLKPFFEKGFYCGNRESLEDIRERVSKELNTLHPGHKRFINPHEYPVGITAKMYEVREGLIKKMSVVEE